jgi:hypothetical protein
MAGGGSLVDEGDKAAFAAASQVLFAAFTGSQPPPFQYDEGVPSGFSP